MAKRKHIFKEAITITVSGPPKSGKTRLLATLICIARALGLTSGLRITHSRKTDSELLLRIEETYDAAAWLKGRQRMDKGL